MVYPWLEAAEFRCYMLIFTAGGPMRLISGTAILAVA